MLGVYALGFRHELSDFGWVESLGMPSSCVVSMCFLWDFFCEFLSQPSICSYIVEYACGKKMHMVMVNVTHKHKAFTIELPWRKLWGRGHLWPNSQECAVGVRCRWATGIISSVVWSVIKKNAWLELRHIFYVLHISMLSLHDRPHPGGNSVDIDTSGSTLGSASYVCAADEQLAPHAVSCRL